MYLDMKVGLSNRFTPGLRKAGASPVPKVCQNAMFFVPLGLALSEKQFPKLLKTQGSGSS